MFVAPDKEAVWHSALSNGALEQSGRLGRENVEHDTRRACALAPNRDLRLYTRARLLLCSIGKTRAEYPIGISSEAGDVLIDPLKSFSLVPKSKISWKGLVTH